MAEFLVTMVRRQVLDVLVMAEDRDEAIQKVNSGRGRGAYDRIWSSEWEYDGTCERMD